MREMLGCWWLGMVERTWADFALLIAIVILGAGSLLNGMKARHHLIWELVLLVIGISLAWFSAHPEHIRVRLIVLIVVPMLLAYASGCACREREEPK